MTKPFVAGIGVTVLLAYALFNAPTGSAGEPPSSEPEIVPFNRILSIEPGRTTYSEVVKLLGKPEKVETADKSVGGRKVLSYPTRGITVITRSDAAKDDSVIDGIYVEAPFKGKSKNGLHLGMAKKDALATCDHDYFRTTDLGISCYFATTKGGDSQFQVWFDGDKLIRMKVFAPLERPK